MNRLVSSWSFIAATAVAVLIAATFAVRAADSTASTPALTSVFKVEGMTCGGCEASVKISLKRLDGVREVTASHSEKRATVTYDAERVSPAAIVEAIEKLGYKAELVDTQPAATTPRSSGLLARLRACC